MDRQIFYNILAGLIFFGAFSLAFASPLPDSDAFDWQGDAQNDDYQYSDDESSPSSHTKSTPASLSPPMVPFFKENDVTVSTIVGKNATLECPARNTSDNNVILWYKGSNALTTGNEVLNAGYALDTTNFALTIINASEASQGEYFCEVQPQKIRQHTTLIVSEHAIEAIVPESSKSSQESLHFKSASALLMASVIGIFLFFRI